MTGSSVTQEVLPGGSWASSAFWWLFRLIIVPYRKRYGGRGQRGPQDFAFPPPNTTECKVDRWDLQGWRMTTVGPEKATPNRAVLYLHGGSYVRPITSTHWAFVALLAKELNVEVTVVPYPLAPYNTVHEVIPTLVQVYAAFKDRANGRELIVAGDSAGGGMSLALMFALDEAGIALPSQVVLISPLLDATGTDPKLAEIQPNDPWLSISAGKQWAGGPDVKNVAGSALRHPYVSPLFGDLSLLKRAGTRVVLCCGTYDILYADALRFAEKCEESGVQCHFIEGQGQIHIFSLLNRFVPEASLACGRTCSIIETNSGISRPSLT